MVMERFFSLKNNPKIIREPVSRLSYANPTRIISLQIYLD